MDQPKIERMLRLLALLSGNIEYTVDELADKLEMSQRTIYRYIDTFKAAGFSVEKVRDYVYHLTTLKSGVADLSNIVYFSPEEAYIVNRLIDGLDSDNALKDGLKQKLAAIYDRTSIADFVDRPSNAKKIQTLAEAIKEKKVVELHRYSSSNSGQTKDYRVEPFAFTNNYAGFWAFDLDAGLNKRYKILRLHDVQKIDEPWSKEYAHHATPMDAFRIHGDKEYHVVVRMNNIAKNLMVEEYPLTEADIRPEEAPVVMMDAMTLPQHDMDNPEEQYWIYDGTVRGMDGIGRFVLGLQHNFDILEGEELRQFLLDASAEIQEKYTEGN